MSNTTHCAACGFPLTAEERNNLGTWRTPTMKVFCKPCGMAQFKKIAGRTPDPVDEEPVPEQTREAGSGI